MKRTFKLLVLLLMVFLLSSCNTFSGKHVTIGGKSFTEQFLLSKMTVFLLEDHGFRVDEMNNLGSSTVRKALENGQVDFMWEYTGTALTTYLGKKPSPDPKKTYQRVKKLDKKNGLLWMNMSQVNNTYALAMRKKEAKKLGIHSISDLAEYVRKHPGKLKMASEAEFTNRPDGLPGVQKKYNFKFGASNVKSMQTGLYYRAIHSHSVDVTVAYSTDPQIKKYNLVLLKDDKHFFPPYYAAVCINKDVYEKYPEIKEITKPLAEHLNSDIMRSLNYQVDVEGKSVSVVAHNWLVKNGLLKD